MQKYHSLETSASSSIRDCRERETILVLMNRSAWFLMNDWLSTINSYFLNLKPKEKSAWPNMGHARTVAREKRRAKTHGLKRFEQKMHFYYTTVSAVVHRTMTAFLWDRITWSGVCVLWRLWRAKQLHKPLFERAGNNNLIYMKEQANLIYSNHLPICLNMVLYASGYMGPRAFLLIKTSSYHSACGPL